jgi:hypothetical protein
VVTGQALQLARAVEQLGEVVDLYTVWKSNVNLLQTYVDEAKEAAGSASGEVKQALDSVAEMLVGVKSEAQDLRQELSALKDILTQA